MEMAANATTIQMVSKHERALKNCEEDAEIAVRKCTDDLEWMTDRFDTVNARWVTRISDLETDQEFRVAQIKKNSRRSCDQELSTQREQLEHTFLLHSSPSSDNLGSTPSHSRVARSALAVDLSNVTSMVVETFVTPFLEYARKFDERKAPLEWAVHRLTFELERCKESSFYSVKHLDHCHTALEELTTLPLYSSPFVGSTTSNNGSSRNRTRRAAADDHSPILPPLAWSNYQRDSAFSTQLLLLPQALRPVVQIDIIPQFSAIDLYGKLSIFTHSLLFKF